MMNVTYASAYYGNLVDVQGYDSNPVPWGRTISVSDTIGVGLLHQPGWVAADASAAAYTPSALPVIEDVFLSNGFVSKRASSGSYLTVGACSGVNPIAYGADPTGAADSTAAVIAAAEANSAGSSANPTVRLGAGTFKLNLSSLDRIYLEGLSSDLTTLIPAALTSPIIDAGGSGSFPDQRSYINKVRFTTGGVDRQHQYPLVRFTLTRNLIFGDDVFFDVAGFTCTCIKLTGAYQARLRGVQFRTGKFAIPIERDNTVGLPSQQILTGTANITNGSYTVTNAAITTGSWRVGDQFVATGVPSRTTIRYIDGTTIRLSQKATATTVGVAVTTFRTPQFDTNVFDMQVDGATAMISRDSNNDAHGDIFFGKCVQTTYYATAPSQNTTLASAAVAGDTTLNLTSASGIVAGDLLMLDPGWDNCEAVRVLSVAGSVATLHSSTPVRFDHASAYAFTGDLASTTTVSNVSSFLGLEIGQAITGTGIPASTTIANMDTSARTITLSAAATATSSGVALTSTETTEVIRGGVGFSYGSGYSTGKWDGWHWEGQQIGVAANNFHNMIFDIPYKGSGRLVHITGNVKNLHVRNPAMYGTVNKNELVRRSANCRGTSDGIWVCDFPDTPSGAPVTPSAPLDYFPHNTRGYILRIDSGSGVIQEFHNNNGLSTVKLVQRNANNNLTMHDAGRLVAVDGVQGKYLSGAGKTTVVDGDFTLTPTDGTEVVHYDTTAGKAYKSVRANGSWKVMSGPV